LPHLRRRFTLRRGRGVYGGLVPFGNGDHHADSLVLRPADGEWRRHNRRPATRTSANEAARDVTADDARASNLACRRGLSVRVDDILLVAERCRSVELAPARGTSAPVLS